MFIYERVCIWCLYYIFATDDIHVYVLLRKKCHILISKTYVDDIYKHNDNKNNDNNK